MEWLAMLLGPLAGLVSWLVTKYILPHPSGLSEDTIHIIQAIYTAAVMQITILGLLIGVVIAILLAWR